MYTPPPLSCSLSPLFLSLFLSFSFSLSVSLFLSLSFFLSLSLSLSLCLYVSFILTFHLISISSIFLSILLNSSYMFVYLCVCLSLSLSFFLSPCITHSLSSQCQNHKEYHLFSSNNRSRFPQKPCCKSFIHCHCDI